MKSLFREKLKAIDLLNALSCQLRRVALMGGIGLAFSAAGLAQTAPSITSQPLPVTADQGGSASFTVSAAGSATLTYQWFKNGTPISAATSTTLSLTNLKASDAASYTLVVANQIGTATSSAAILTVLATPVVTSPSTASGYVGVAFQYVLTAGNGITGASASGLPSGLAVNSSSGAITGMPTVAGTFPVNLTVSDAAGTGIPFVLTLTIAPTPFILNVLAGGQTGSADGTGSAAQFSSPNGMAIDGQGNIYIADTGNSTIRRVSPGGGVTTFAGTAGTVGSADGVGAAAKFSSPEGVAVDGSGNVYVADTGNDTIRRITSSGLSSTIAGVAGQSGSSDGTGGTALFNGPAGIAVDSSGNLYVSDGGNDTIRKISPTNVVTTLAGVALQAGYIDAFGIGARFNNPSGIALDSAGNIYVNDLGNQFVRKITSAGGVSTLASTKGPVDLGDASKFNGVATDSVGNVYLTAGPVYTDEGIGIVGFASTVLVISPSGVVSTLQVWTGVGSSFGAGAIVPTAVTGTAVDSSGNIYVLAGGVLEKSAGFAAGPSIATQPQSQTVSSGQNVIFTVAATGDPVPAYQWQLNGVAISGATSSTYAISGAQNANAGTYSVVVSTSYGMVTSNAAVLTVSSSATVPMIVTQPQSQFVLIDVGATLSVTASGSGPLSYQWYFNNGPIGGATSAVLNLNNVQQANSGSYFVIVSNANGVAVSNVAILTAGLNQGVASITAQPKSQSVGVGAAVTLGIAASGSGLTYQWQKNGVSISGATASTYIVPSAQATDAGSYSVLVTNASGTVDSALVSVGVNASPGQTYLNTWNAATLLPSSTLYTSLAFDGTHYLAAGTDGSLFTSPDALSWNAISPAPGRLNSLVYVGAPYGFIGVGDNGVVLSSAAPTYSVVTQSTPTTNLLTGFAVGNGRMVAVGYQGTGLTSTFQTPAWTAGITGTTNSLNAVAFGNGVFVAVGLGGTVLTSQTGSLWTVQNLGSPTNMYSVAYGPAGFVAIGDLGTSDAVYTSPDGVTWTAQPVPANLLLIRLIYANRTFIAVGGTGAIVTSTDGGFTWTAANSGTTNTLEGVAFGASAFVAVGDKGVVTESAQAVSRLANISARAFVGSGANSLIAGFVTSGSVFKEILIRGVGPTLAQFGVGGVLATPQLTLFNGNSTPIASDAAWGGSTTLSSVFTQVGAFALPPTSADAAIEQLLPPGAYTAQVSSTTGTGGVALAEIYDADAGIPASRLINISARASVGTSSSVLIAGFVISGNNADTVLIRGVGPGLSSAGLTGLLANPTLTLFDSNGNALATNSAWGGTAALTAAFTQVGAFSLNAASSDTALLVALPPGAYTAEVSGANGTSGLALVELYEVH